MPFSPAGDGGDIFHRAREKVIGVEWELQLRCFQFLGSHCLYRVGVGDWETLQGFLLARLGLQSTVPGVRASAVWESGCPQKPFPIFLGK